MKKETVYAIINYPVNFAAVTGISVGIEKIANLFGANNQHCILDGMICGAGFMAITGAIDLASKYRLGDKASMWIAREILIPLSRGYKTKESVDEMLNRYDPKPK